MSAPDSGGFGAGSYELFSYTGSLTNNGQILLSGGTTLDAWAIKNYLFNIDKSDPVGWIYRALGRRAG